MPNYKNSKIYIIKSYKTDKIYYGSTTEKLCKRMAKHRNSYKRYLNGEYGYTTSFDIIKEGDSFIELVENVICDNVEELKKRERYYIDNFECVNKYKPLRTMSEYHQDHKEKRNKNSKDWYEKNYANKKYKCVCGSELLIHNKKNHEKTMKHFKYLKELKNKYHN